MRINAISEITETGTNDDGLNLTQRTCKISAAAQSALLVPVLVAVMVPFGILAAEAVAHPETLDQMTQAPINTLSAITGAIVWGLMFGIPAWHALWRIGSKRSVKIAGSTVMVTNTNLLGSTSWQAPLQDFQGLSHHQRTSLSGTREELILIHKRDDRCLLLRMAENISQDETEEMASRLGVSLLSPGAMFRRHQSFQLPKIQLPPLFRLQRA